MKRIVYLPLDERPCNYNFASLIAENNGDFSLIKPPLDILGDKKKPADFDKLNSFLIKETANADYLILSVDMLLYGGIAPSRLHSFSEEILENRLNLLKDLKRKNDRLKICAFSLIMRCPTYSSDDEEPFYYGLCGREIFLYGQNEHMYKSGVIKKEEYEEREKALYPIVKDYLPDFLNRRKTNINLVFKALDLVGKVIDKFIIPQDDSSPYGYTSIDQKRVKKYLQEKGLNVDIYPGADEVGMTLLSLAMSDIRGYTPKICPIYPNERCKNVIPLFEDREVYKSIAFQIKNAGGELSDEESADILLFCNLPLDKMKDVIESSGEKYNDRDLTAFLDKMKRAVKEGRKVAVADIAYSNGGDIELASLIEKEIGFFSLSGYAGWNTSSNTLGTVICQSIASLYYGKEALRKFTALRVYEDIGYCYYTRWYVTSKLLKGMGYEYKNAGEKRGAVSEVVKKNLEEFIKENFESVYNAYRIGDVYMPWKRMFEVGITLEKV